MSNTVELLSAEVRAAQELRRWLENERASDPQFDDLILDAIEGQTNLHEMIATLAREARAASAMAEGLDKLITDMASRGVRLERRADSLRAAIGRAMDEAGIPKVISPDATITYRHGTPQPFVEDASLLPDQFVRTKIETKPDLKAIREYGRPIPGVVMRNGAPVLQIRGK